VSAGTSKSAYVLYGDDTYLRDTHRKRIISDLAGDADPRLCLSRFDSDAELTDVLDELRTPSLMARVRIVVVRDADAFVTTHRKALERYLDAPVAHASLILLVSNWRRGTRLDKRIRAIGEVIDCSGGGDPVEWVSRCAAERDKQIDREAARLLAEWVGEDRGALETEVEKLSLYAAQRQRITAEDVAELATDVAGAGAFGLINAITAGDVAEALSQLSRSLQRRGEEFRLLGGLLWHLRRSLAVKQQLEAGRRPDLRMGPQARQALLGYVRRRTRTRLQADFRKLLRADLAMKTGTPPETALQPLLVELCS